MKFLHIALFICVTLCSQAADFNSIVADVLSTNPALKADSLTASAELQELAMGGNLPDPEVGFEHKWGGGEKRWGLEVSQSFDWPGVYAARSRALSAAREAERFMAMERIREKSIEVRTLLLDIVAANNRVRILTEVQANVDTLLALTRRQFDTGNATILTLKKTEFEQYNIANTLADAIAEQDRLRVELAAMAGGRLIDTDTLLDFPAQTLESEESYAQTGYYAADALQAAARRDRASQRAESLSRLPGFSVGYVHDFEEGIHFNGFSVGLSLPVFSTRHAASAARLRAEATETQAVAAKLDRTAQIRANYATARRLASRIEAFDRIFGSTDYLPLLKKSLDAGQTTVSDYLRDVNDYLAARLDHISTCLSYHRSLVTLSN